MQIKILGALNMCPENECGADQEGKTATGAGFTPAGP
jgi:hypothetical protein